ncbi:putative ROK1-ATP-dependent RNA helicase [Phlyctochytrium arcticum]|nr:putative ROK1-ATP-dependent RNA helicase [Phlyctochytrium arcticum]
MDIFRVLGTGAKFDRKRFREDVEVFKAPEQSRTILDNGSAVAGIAGDSEVAAELDFFNVQEAPPPAVKDASVKRKNDDDDEESEDKAKSKKSKRSDGKKAEEVIDYTPFASVEAASIYRKQHKIRIYGTDIPNPLQSFAELRPRFSLRPFLARNLIEHEYTTPTPIQLQAIPILLHGRDLMACAPTGSGKTLAYLLPIVHSLRQPGGSQTRKKKGGEDEEDADGSKQRKGIRAVIICPTRELASQIHRELQKLVKTKPFKVCVLTKMSSTPTDVPATSNPSTSSTTPSAGTSSSHLSIALNNFDILISTPKRLVHAIQQQGLSLARVKHLVLDEADKLLELGFLDQIDEILAACPEPENGKTGVNRALFSATISSGVESMAKTFMRDPVRVVIGQKNAATETINQKLLYVGQENGKLIAIRQLIQTGGLKPPVLIFVQSIDRAKDLFNELVYDGINVDVIHSERTKAQREKVVQHFREGKTWVLIATDLMGRGIDFKGVNLVINYDFPQSVAAYVHRIGRTGRAGRAGEAVTYFTKEDAPYLKAVVNVMRESGCDVPEWMLDLKKPSSEAKKAWRKRVLGGEEGADGKKSYGRDKISTMARVDTKKIQHKKQMVEGTKK